MLVLRFLGVVQGVGFRPAVYRAAMGLGLYGGVYNDSGDAIVILDRASLAVLKPVAISPKARFVRFYPYSAMDSSGTLPSRSLPPLLLPSSLLSSSLLSFLGTLFCALPKQANITHIAIHYITPHSPALGALPSLAQHIAMLERARFSILPSLSHPFERTPSPHAQSPLSIPTDSATCSECLQEIFSPTSRFYHYHLCACTNCGARYSIIDSLPYDRERTSMRDFPLCAACKQDFSTPSSRFYHAQPISCNTCAIRLRLLDSRSNATLASDYAGIELCARLLAQGEIVCIKGLGGFALICDSTNARTINRLRERKSRPHKPFAIMCKDIEQARSIAHLCKEEEDALLCAAAPIVLARAKDWALGEQDYACSDKSVIASLRLRTPSPSSCTHSQNTDVSPTIPESCAKMGKPINANPRIFEEERQAKSEKSQKSHASLESKKLDSSEEVESIDCHADKFACNDKNNSALDCHASAAAVACNDKNLDSSPQAQLSSKAPSPIATNAIAPSLSTLGILLANTPLHHLLLDLFPHPIIYTSANLSGEPIATSADEALSLAHITPYVLDIDREILHGVDDSIMRYIDSSMRPIRLARGLAPRTIATPLAKPTPTNQATLALGAGEKITPVLATSTHTTITPYIGSLQSPKALARLEENLAVFLPSMPKLSTITSDKHPRFETTTLAQSLASEHHATHLMLHHHYAHHCAIWAEMACDENEQILSIVWDGSGLGADGSIWGGEFLLGDCREITRVGYFTPFALLGGERAIADIKRIAYILALEAGSCAMIARYEACLPAPLLALAKERAKGIMTSSVGRIIDGVAHLLGLLDSSTYEGQAGALLESIALKANAKESSYAKSPYPYTIAQNGLIQWQPMIVAICDDIQALESTSTTTSATKGTIAYKFLYTLAHIAQAFILRTQTTARVGLSGGVFQNKLLCEILGAMLRAQGISYHFHTLVPCNDGGIAFGQAVFASRT